MNCVAQMNFVNCPSSHSNKSAECDALRKTVSEHKDPVCSSVYDGKHIYEFYMFYPQDVRIAIVTENFTIHLDDVSFN